MWDAICFAAPSPPPLGFHADHFGPPDLHLRDDEVRGTVQYSLQRLDLVGGKTLPDVRDNGNAAGDAGIEGDGAAELAGPVKNLRPVLRQQGLVRGHHVFAALEQLQHDGPGGLHATDEVGDNLDVGIAGDAGQVAR